jgi:16S rRNA (guanine527-N7)-methyltransferase
MTRLVKTLESLRIGAQFGETLQRFVALFLKWNERINLSSASTASEIEDHVRDSLHLVPHLNDAPRVIDVGSGGGFPVVIAAICLPSTHFVALEPVHKKHAFLRTAARELALVNLEAHAKRVEDHQGRDYDAATSRATFDLRDWFTTGLELVRVGGVVAGFEAILRTDLPPTIERHPYALDDKQRSIVLLRKTTT